MDIKRIFGENLKLLRKKQCMTQEEFAEKLNISTNHLAKLETGIKFASPELIARIAITLSIPPSYLFYTSESNYIDDSYSGKVEKILIEEMAIIRKRIREII